MDVPTTIALGLSAIATIFSGTALFFVWKIQKQIKQKSEDPNRNKNEHYSEIANMLSDGALVWQQVVVNCDEISAELTGTHMQQNGKETIGDWLLQLREFSKSSKTEIDHAYQLFATEAKGMSSEDMELQRPDMEKFNKEMRSNVAAITGQLDHISSIVLGNEALGNRQFKITLHKPQVMPHFLRKRQKIAELQRRRGSGGNKNLAEAAVAT